jgi:integrase
VAAYAGLRQGELLALRWRDVDFAGSALTVARAMSAGVESTTKSGRVRRVPLADQAAAALDRLSRREHFTAPGELVFCNVFGRPLDGSALRRRYRRAQNAAEVRPLRFHDLRHTFGSLLAARGVDVVTIQSAMGHSALRTTGRYLRAAGVRAGPGVHGGVRAAGRERRRHDPGVGHAPISKSISSADPLRPDRSALFRSAGGCKAGAVRS